MSVPTIEVNGTTVRLVVPDGVKLDVPRRQSFAWSKDARRYAKLLSEERGWPIGGSEKW